MSVTSYISYITKSNSSDVGSIRDLKYAFALGLVAFMVFSPFYCSRKSWWDAIAANKMIGVLRMLIFVEVMGLLLLLYFTIMYGSPLTLHQFTSYGNGDSWIYGVGRPVAGIILIGVGSMGDMHPLPRLVCAFGVLVQMVADSFSAYQVGEYIDQTNTLSAPTGKYPDLALTIYYWRDLSSVGVCAWICLLNLLFIATVGVCNPPFLTYQTIAGGDFDRCEVMRKERQLSLPAKLAKQEEQRKYYERFYRRKKEKEEEELRDRNSQGQGGGVVVVNEMSSEV